MPEARARRPRLRFGFVRRHRTGYVAPVHPIAFKLGTLTVHWYGILVATGFVLGLWLASRRGRRDGLPPEVIADLGTWLIVGAIVGSRALYVITFWDAEFSGRPWTDVLRIWRGGLVFYGGFIGAALAGFGCCLWKQVPAWKVADALAPSIALGFALGRLGCLMNGCCYGKPSDLPWAVSFPATHDTGGAPVHPTQLYDVTWALGLFAFLEWLYRHKRFNGQVFAVFIAGYAALRSAVELLRGDYGASQFRAGLTPAQQVGLGLLALAAWLYWSRARAARKASTVARE